MNERLTVRNILEGKRGGKVISIGPKATVFEALRLMALYDVGALPVMESGRVVGIISERDYARKVVLANRTSRDTRVEEIMRSAVYYVEPEDPVEDCLALMHSRKIRHLPVFEAGRMIGIVSISDLLRAAISERERLVNTLGEYAMGPWYGNWRHTVAEQDEFDRKAPKIAGGM